MSCGAGMAGWARGRASGVWVASVMTGVDREGLGLRQDGGRGGGGRHQDGEAGGGQVGTRHSVIQA
ncbi:hypothetical protein [Brevundimonas sp.]|uniref:hypothetical protein n=1 Tax=Brevundimonas sp. TaxID=1871086 RepID=UPI003AFF7768